MGEFFSQNMCRIVIQRVLKASVHVEGDLVGECGRGLMVLVGIHRDDTEKDVAAMVKKMVSVNLFPKDDETDGRWEESVSTREELQVLLVSQFTLLATFKGKKPIFSKSMAPDQARELFDKFVELTREALGDKRVQTGRFGALLEVSLVNHGPVTMILDSKK